ncbi:non-hydrolyzing UDP-N-acetylglucosamine 2-epimerase [Desulfohalovibrio reitneri]|uniref:non-hydrolyzing UDP-N-acetylglucosamine 2-epimerase n=1 Tax=Desulfohalovibrio reitneri TaxID=1307759 RepID=UPI0004A778C6|nr:UDP-N-acetylglucosamine 2-epimerase (non-hydrolyzing) [Desulfohalovibrio reitneri]
MPTVCTVVGARPNYMKAGPLHAELRGLGLRQVLVHTGQHYGDAMSGVFFRQLGLPEPDHHLGVGSGSHAETTGRVMAAFERVLLADPPDLVVVVGDVDSTLAAALTARKLHIPVAHVEAGLRSFDETMPEEINRRLTDSLANLLFASEPSAMGNLRREGVDMDRARLTGDVMLESLDRHLESIRCACAAREHGVEPGGYALCTIHRPHNVDTPEALTEILNLLEMVEGPILLPLHPRTKNRLAAFDLDGRLAAIRHVRPVEPLPYLGFLDLMRSCRLLLSDSGSVQAEASWFDAPCLICRENTERPVYVEEGTTTLVGRDPDKLAGALRAVEAGTYKRSTPRVRELGRGVARSMAEGVAAFLGL